MTTESEDFLAHFGIPGMKWGQRNDDKGRTGSLQRARTEQYKTKVAAAKTAAQTKVSTGKAAAQSKVAAGKAVVSRSSGVVSRAVRARQTQETKFHDDQVAKNQAQAEAKANSSLSARFNKAMLRAVPSATYNLTNAATYLPKDTPKRVSKFIARNATQQISKIKIGRVAKLF